jgi:hypothetical protein
MIYGRRFFEKSKPWQQSNNDYRLPSKEARNQGQALKWTYRQFQLKYIIFLAAGAIGASLVFMIPAWYFSHQNFSIFKALAYDVQPDLIVHLEREIQWLKGFLVACLALMAIFSVSMAYRIINAILGPLIGLENHMRKVALGDWKNEDFHQRSEDDFRSLATTYSYLYRSLRAQNEADLRQLEKLSIDPHRREAHMAWQTLIQTKRTQLGLENQSSDPAVEISLVPQKRRAS